MKSLSVVAVLLLVASFASADITQSFVVNRDSGMDMGAPNANAGAAGQVRGAKATWKEDASWYDWDPAPIDAYIAANGGSGSVAKIEFFLKTASTTPGNVSGKGIQVWTLRSGNDWVEGSGGDIWTNFNWPADTAAVTCNYAQEYWTMSGTYKVVDTTRSIPWTNPVSGAATDIRNANVLGLRNSVDWTPGIGSLPGWYSVQLDTAFWQELLDRMANPNTRGLILFDLNDAGENPNWEAYMRENAGGANAAYLQVTMIPEPATLGLIAFGAVTMLLKKRRRAQ